MNSGTDPDALDTEDGFLAAESISIPTEDSSHAPDGSSDSSHPSTIIHPPVESAAAAAAGVLGDILDRVAYDAASTDETPEEKLASIGDDFIVIRKAHKRSLLTPDSSAEHQPKRSLGLFLYSSSSSSSSSSSTSYASFSDDGGDNPKSVAEALKCKESIPQTKEDDEEDFIGPRLPSRSRRPPVVIKDDEEDDSDDEDSFFGSRRLPRPRRTPVVIKDDDDDDDSDDDADHDNDGSPTAVRTRTEDEEAKEEETGVLPSPPPPNWRATVSLRAREYGASGFGKSCRRARSHGGFVRDACGSRFCVEKFDLLCKLDNHRGCVNTLNFNQSGSKLATGSDDLHVIVWDWNRASSRGPPEAVRAGAARHRWPSRSRSNEGKLDDAICIKYDSGHRSNVFQAKFLPFTNDAVIVSCARDGQVRVADISSDGTCRGTRRLASHRLSAHKLATSAASSHSFLSCGEDAVVKNIDLRSDRPTDLLITRHNGSKIPLYSVNAHPLDSHLFITSGKDPWVRLYDRRQIRLNDTGDAAPLKRFAPRALVETSSSSSHAKCNVTCAVFSHDGSEILATYNDEDIYLFDTDADGNDDGVVDRHVHRYSGHRNSSTVKGVNFYGPSSEFVVSGSDCGHVFLWDKKSETLVNFLDGDEGGVVNCLEPHPSLPVLATSGLDHDIKVWSPTKEGGPDFSALLKTIKKNGRDRADDSNGEGTLLDSQMLWFLMQHLRRSRRRRDGEDEDEDDDDEDLGGMSSDDDDDDGVEEPEADPRAGNVIDCNPS